MTVTASQPKLYFALCLNYSLSFRMFFFGMRDFCGTPFVPQSELQLDKVCESFWALVEQTLRNIGSISFPGIHKVIADCDLRCNLYALFFHSLGFLLLRNSEFSNLLQNLGDFHALLCSDWHVYMRYFFFPVFIGTLRFNYVMPELGSSPLHHLTVWIVWLGKREGF